MRKQNSENIEKVVEKKYAKREKKGRSKMKVSGSGVRRLGRIISDKANRDKE